MDAAVPPVHPILDFIAAIDWLFVVIVVCTAIPLIYLYNVSKDPKKLWRYEQLVEDENGRAYSPSFTHMGTFVAFYFSALALVKSREWGYLIGLLGTMATTFAVVTIWRGSTKAKVQVEKIKAEQGIVDPPSGTVTSTQQVQP